MQNILFISLDDVAPLFGCYAHPHVNTPNLDALAADGVTFNRAYCQVPVCNPSRASVLTGLRPATTGVFCNYDEWTNAFPSDHPTLPELFRSQGYETIKIGKIEHRSPQTYDQPDPNANQRIDAMWERTLSHSGKSKEASAIPAHRPKQDVTPEFADSEAADFLNKTMEWGPTGFQPLEQQDGAIAEAAAQVFHGLRNTSIRTPNWRYSEWGSDKHRELYHHPTDPREVTNLAYHPDHQETQQRLHQLLHAGWQAALPD